MTAETIALPDLRKALHASAKAALQVGFSASEWEAAVHDDPDLRAAACIVGAREMHALTCFVFKVDVHLRKRRRSA
jgi:hypothetical protein